MPGTGWASPVDSGGAMGTPVVPRLRATTMPGRLISAYMDAIVLAPRAASVPRSGARVVHQFG
jgi:hypothetical protein